MKWKPENIDELYDVIHDIIIEQKNNPEYPYGLKDIDVSLITDMSKLFSCDEGDKNCDINNQIDWGDPRNDIITWNVSNVTNMNRMFYSSPFNQPIGNWDVSNVTSMISMFYKSEFDKNLYKWLNRLNLLLSQNSHILGVYKNVDLYHFNIDSPHEKKFGSINNLEDFIDKQKNPQIDILKDINSIDRDELISIAKDLDPKEWIELVNKIDNPNLKMEILKSKIDIDINSKDEVKENLSNDNKVINININLDLGDLDR